MNQWGRPACTAVARRGVVFELLRVPGRSLIHRVVVRWRKSTHAVSVVLGSSAMVWGDGRGCERRWEIGGIGRLGGLSRSDMTSWVAKTSFLPHIKRCGRHVDWVSWSLNQRVRRSPSMRRRRGWCYLDFVFHGRLHGAPRHSPSSAVRVIAILTRLLGRIPKSNLLLVGIWLWLFSWVWRIL